LSRSDEGWIGVDLDGTLAHCDERNVLEWDGSIGEPVPLMVDRVKRWIALGMQVRIVTARVAHVDGVTTGARGVAEQLELVRAWSVKHLGVALEVTAQKDCDMRELWDDKAIGVITNAGVPLFMAANRERA
jgi:hypothetical protein